MSYILRGTVELTPQKDPWSTLNSTVPVRVQQHIDATCLAPGVEVRISQVLIGAGGGAHACTTLVVHRIPWCQVSHMEYLAGLFKAQRVDVFEQVVTLLGRAHRLQDTILEILDQEV